MNSRTSIPMQPVDQLQIFKHRRGLSRTLQAIAEGQLNLGFIGGSITEDWERNWPNPVTGWFLEQYPNVTIVAENAAIGATGSDSGCLRVDREIIQRDCHLTFVEYAVNDHEKPTERRFRTREGLLRKLLAARQDVVLVYTFRQEMYAEMMEGKIPASIAEFEQLAEHYGIGSIWVGLHALNEVRAGRMKWAEWLPDKLHPSTLGSWSYGRAIIDYLRRELSASIGAKSGYSLPKPLNEFNWQSALEMPLTNICPQGPWLLKRVYGTNHVGRVWETHTPGARLKFDFVGRGVAFIFDYGKNSCEFNYRIDGGAWVPVVRERPEWAGPRGMVRALIIADELCPGQHSFEMELTHGDRTECAGTECRLAQISIL
jgi:hypothetical protein